MVYSAINNYIERKSTINNKGSFLSTTKVSRNSKRFSLLVNLVLIMSTFRFAAAGKYTHNVVAGFTRSNYHGRISFISSSSSRRSACYSNSSSRKNDSTLCFIGNDNCHKSNIRFYHSSKKEIDDCRKNKRNHAKKIFKNINERKKIEPSTTTTEKTKTKTSSLSMSFFDSVDKRTKELRKSKKVTRHSENNTHNKMSDVAPTPRKDVGRRKSKTIVTIDLPRKSNKTRLNMSASSTNNGSESSSISSTDNVMKEAETDEDIAFLPSSFKEYQEILEELISSPKFLRKKDPNDVEIVKKHLFSNVNLPILTTTSSSSSDQTENRENLHQELSDQQKLFIQKTNFTKTHLDYMMRALTSLGDRCARLDRKIAPLPIAWRKIKESGTILSQRSLNTFLYVLQNDKNANNIDSQLIQEEIDEVEDIARMHDILYKPTEQSVSLRIKRMISKGNAKKAEQLLDSMETSDSPSDKTILKLRTYFPVLQHYCENPDMLDDAIHLLFKMRQSPGVILEPETHVLLLASLAENGYFLSNKEYTYHHQSQNQSTENEQHQNWLKYIIETSSNNYDVKDLTFTGPQLFNHLAQNMADDVLEITSASAHLLSKSFNKGHNELATDEKALLEDNNNKNDDDDDFLLMNLTSLKSMPVRNQTAHPTELVADRVLIDSKTGVCNVTETKLRLLLLDEPQIQQFQSALRKLSSDQYITFNKIKKNKSSKNETNDSSSSAAESYAIEQLDIFSQWLESSDKPYTAIIDGANIAYYGQNFQNGNFNYHQIKYVVDALEEKGENVLVVIPWKYTNKSFYLSSMNYVDSKKKRNMYHLSEEEFQILQNLNETKKMYRVPARCLDDYYWMMASVSNQHYVPSSYSKNQFLPGIRPVLITNDQMRDHKLELLEPRLFRRWTSCHIVNYNFPPFVGSEQLPPLDDMGSNSTITKATNETTISNTTLSSTESISFSPPDFFSREIQGNPSGKKGKDDGSVNPQDSSMVWHFPVSDWLKNERFCIRIPTK